MASPQLIILKCNNPECGKQFKSQRPTHPGVFPITCPHCSNEMKVRFQGVPKEVKMGQSDRQQPAPAKKNVTPPGQTTQKAPIQDHSQDAPIAIGEDFVVGTKKSVPCPHCGSTITYTARKEEKRTLACPRCHGQVITNGVEPEPLEGMYDMLKVNDVTCPHCGFINSYKPERDGKNGFDCKECHGRIVIRAQMKTQVFGPVISAKENAMMSRGRLVQIKSWLKRDQVYSLREGINTIGRYDQQQQSHIAIQDDPTMSRRSVQIEVMRTSAGYQFKFTVLRAANPIFVNDKPLVAGEAEPLKFGDIIKMGNTKFRFEKDK